jgi:hypothetical protein
MVGAVFEAFAFKQNGDRPVFYFAVAISVKLLIAIQNDGVSGAVEKSRPQKEPR